MFIMASKNTQVNLPKRIAEYCNKLYWLAMKLHNTAVSIGFTKKALYTHVTVNLAKVKGSLPIMKKNIKLKAGRSFLRKWLKEATKLHHKISGKLMTF